MDFLKKAQEQLGGNEQSAEQRTEQRPEGSTEQKQEGGTGGFLGGLKNSVNSAAGGGVESEKNEDMLDKGIDFVQEKFMGQGAQNNESAVEQAKDEQISDFIRSKYKATTGGDIPIKDKPTRLDH